MTVVSYPCRWDRTCSSNAACCLSSVWGLESCRRGRFSCAWKAAQMLLGFKISAHACFLLFVFVHAPLLSLVRCSSFPQYRQLQPHHVRDFLRRFSSGQNFGISAQQFRAMGAGWLRGWRAMLTSLPITNPWSKRTRTSAWGFWKLKGLTSRSLGQFVAIGCTV